VSPTLYLCRTPQQQRVPRTADRQQEAPASNGLQQSPADRAAEPAQQPAAANGSAEASGKAAASAEHDEEGDLVPRLGRLRDEGYSMHPSQKELQVGAWCAEHVASWGVCKSAPPPKSKAVMLWVVICRLFLSHNYSVARCCLLSLSSAAP
jgi:hypothetical protein